MTRKQALLSYSQKQLEELMVQLGEPSYRGRQLYEWIHQHLAASFDEMTNLPADLRAQLATSWVIDPLEVVRRQVDTHDGTRKYLLRSLDGELIESVMMAYQYGRSICISSQIGCKQGCKFCASTIGGLTRNLEVEEIVAQPYAFAREFSEEEHPIASVVFMGMGEPMENYDNVLEAIRLLHSPVGLNISYRRMTISTSGFVPEIDRLADEGLPITLAVSLHAPNDEVRSRIMPINREYPVAELVSASRRYAEKTGRRVSFEYILIRGVNDDVSLARDLAQLLRGFLAHVNLIPLNPVAERPWERPSDEQVERFRLALEEAGIPTTLRRTLGADIDAACGQLRRRELLGNRTN